jgi:hypothetical protein
MEIADLPNFLAQKSARNLANSLYNPESGSIAHPVYGMAQNELVTPNVAYLKRWNSLKMII